MAISPLIHMLSAFSLCRADGYFGKGLKYSVAIKIQSYYNENINQLPRLLRRFLKGRRLVLPNQYCNTKANIVSINRLNLKGFAFKIERHNI